MGIIEKLVAWLDTAPAGQRAKAADALVRAWQLPSLEDEQREAAEAAMTCLLDDSDESVRKALSSALCDLADPPRHLVIALAADTVDVSLPVLASSTAILDGELIRLVETGSAEQQAAIAGRAYVSAPLAAALAEHGDREACLDLVTNPAAQISEPAFFMLAGRFAGCTEMRTCLLARPDIGMRTRTLLVEAYAESLIPEAEREQPRRRLQAAESAEKAIITYAAQVCDRDNRQLVEALIAREKLTTAFLLRAICMGNLTLFCHALSVLADQPADRVERVLKDLRTNAFHALYAKSGMPASAGDVFLAVLRCWCHHLAQDREIDADRLPYRVTREVLARYQGRRDVVVDELLLLLRRICADSARDSARVTVQRMALAARTAEALPAPQPEPLPDLPPEQLAAFAEHLAEELADLALRDEYTLGEMRDALEPANQQWQAAVSGEANGSCLPDAANGMDRHVAA